MTATGSAAATPATANATPPPPFAGGDAVDREALLAAPLAPRTPHARLARPLTDLRGVGAKLAASAARIGLATIGDLLEHYPHDWIDRSEISTVSAIAPGRRRRSWSRFATSRLRPTRRRNLRIVEATVADESGSVEVVWFNQAWLAEQLRPGVRLLLSGRLDGRGFRARCVRDRRRRRGRGRGAPQPAARRPRSAPRPPHDRDRAGPSGGEGLRVQRIREWVWAALALAGGRRSSRCRPRCGPATASRGPPPRASRSTSPATAIRSEPARAPARLRGALPSSGRAAAPPRRAPIGSARGAARRARGADRAAGSSRFRSLRPATSERRSRRSTPTSSGPSRCSGC